MRIRVNMVDGDFYEFDTPLSIEEFENFSLGLFREEHTVTGIDQISGVPVAINPKFVKDVQVVG